MDRQIIGALKLRAQRKVPPARQIGRIENHTCLGIERAGRAYANRGNCCSGVCVSRLVDSSLHGVESSGRFAPAEHGRSLLKQDLALAVDQPCCYLRASDVQCKKMFCSWQNSAQE